MQPFFCSVFLFFTIILNPFSLQGIEGDPIAIYLTWQSDPTSSMTVQWITHLNKEDDLLQFQHSNGQDSWHTLIAYHTRLPFQSNYLLHRVEMINLESDTIYEFRIGYKGLIYKFKTLPEKLNAPLRFVVGGDIYHDSLEALKQTNLQASKTNPAFALQGGDLAYSSKKIECWVEWLSTWKDTMLTPEGCLIPMVVTLGNHDTKGYYGEKPEDAAIFYTLFRAPNTKAYYSFDVSDYLALTVLDSGHTNSIQGEQARWLDESLEKRKDIPHKFALYHVPAYPSARKINSKKSPIIREHWVPIFEKHGLDAAFEHHDHCYKRSVPIKGGKGNPNGVLYLGDGAWGVEKPRSPKKDADHAWYLAKAVPVRHFILVTLENHQRSYEAIDFMGYRFDYYSTQVSREQGTGR